MLLWKLVLSSRWVGCLGGSGVAEQVEGPAPKRGNGFEGILVLLNSLRKKCFPRRSVTSAAKAGAENKLVIAAVNRCATQKQEQTEFFRKLFSDTVSQASHRNPDLERTVSPTRQLRRDKGESSQVYAEKATPRRSVFAGEIGSR